MREEDQVDGDTPELRGSAQAAGINNNRNGNSGIERSRPLNPFDEEYDDDDDSPVPYYTADDRHHLPASEPRHSTRYSTRTSPVPISSSHSQQPYPVPSSLPPRDTSTSTERGIFGAGPNSHSQQQQQHYRSSARRELLYNKEPDPFTTPDTTDSSSVPSDSLWNSLASMGRRVTNKKKQKEAQPVPPSSSSHSRSRSVDLNKIAPPPPGLDKRESSATNWQQSYIVGHKSPLTASPLTQEEEEYMTRPPALGLRNMAALVVGERRSRQAAAAAGLDASLVVVATRPRTLLVMSTSDRHLLSFLIRKMTPPTFTTHSMSTLI